MNELDLIKEVEKRPILYDRTVSGFNKTKQRDDAWKDVQETLNVTEVECKKRWRSLRDSFIKLQRTHGGRTRWPYHHAMRFLLPHVEPKVENGISKTKEEDSDPEEPEPQTKAKPEPDPLTKAKPELDPPMKAKPAPAPPLPSLPALSSPKHETKPSEDEDEDEQPFSKKPRLNSVEEEAPSSCQCNRSDPDELFLLSCAPILKRLSAKQNAGARLKIQQALYAAEFGTHAICREPAE